MAQFPPTQTVHYLLLNLIGVAQLLNLLHLAEVAELADAPDSKSGARKGVRVRVPPSVLSGIALCLSALSVTVE